MPIITIAIVVIFKKPSYLHITTGKVLLSGALAAHKGIRLVLLHS